jgi:hypothetical protein
MRILGYLKRTSSDISQQIAVMILAEEIRIRTRRLFWIALIHNECKLGFVR